MTFEQWWSTLTPAEHKTIGINNARFVWRQAHQSCATLCEDTVVGSEQQAALKIFIASVIRQKGEE